MSATRTTCDVVTTTVFTTGTPSSTLRASPQGGILEGANPSTYNPSNPIIMFIIQAGIIIIFCRLLHWPLSRLRQPRVIAEVIGGVLLGPSVMGRIPGFQDAIFPAASMPNLTLVANLGLVLFLFLVGLEVDFRFLVSNWRIAVSVGFAGMALPFGLGCAIAWGLYTDFSNEPGTKAISFGVFMLFIGVAMAITAFPVLCRILTELKLLNTPVGIIVLSAGVANDVVGWILLALCVALVNASSGLTALWILLTAVGYILLLTFLVRPLFIKLLVKTRALQDGPSQSIIALTLLIALGSAFFTGIIGIHPIFGAFMAGLMCPHEGGFAIKITEKVEDLVMALFLPLYFALSGLSTNLGLLNDGLTWGYVIGIIAVAFIAKIAGGSGAARLNGLVWRECFTIGALMSCKGLVELIVLNVGLQAQILSQRTFTMFVVMALVTTFATTPIVSALYPPWYQRKLEAWKRGEIDWKTGKSLDADGQNNEREKSQSHLKRILIYLRLDTMPSLISLISLLEIPRDQTETSPVQPKVEKGSTPQRAATPSRTIEIHGLRLLELTERVSSVMKVSEVDESTLYDPVVNTFRTFGRLQNVSVSGEVAIVPTNLYADTLASMAAEMSSDLLLLPWSETGGISEFQVTSPYSTANKLDSSPYTEFIESTLQNASCNTAIFVNNGFGGTAKPARRLSRTFSGFSTRPTTRDRAVVPLSNRSHHIFLPYMGSEDDKVALRLVLQLAQHPDVTVKIVRFKSTAFDTEAVATAEQTARRDGYTAFFDSVCSSLPQTLKNRVSFETVQCREIQEAVLSHAKDQVAAHVRNAGDLLVVGRNTMPGETSCLGAMGEALVKSSIEASLLAVQSASKDHNDGRQ